MHSKLACKARFAVKSFENALIICEVQYYENTFRQEGF